MKSIFTFIRSADFSPQEARRSPSTLEVLRASGYARSCGMYPALLSERSADFSPQEAWHNPSTLEFLRASQYARSCGINPALLSGQSADFSPQEATTHPRAETIPTRSPARAVRRTEVRAPWRLRLGRALAALLLLLSTNAALAFPPAPYHLLYGLVRDQYGTPVTVYPADIYLETPAGVRVRARLSNSFAPGVNYRLEVPMDAGLTTDLYQPAALRASVQFKLKLLIGKTTYVPIEMAGDFARIGKPGEETRLDLTMGVDSDGDGIPDAWEQILISRYGGTLASISGQDDADGDGISNRDEFLAGTYPFDPKSGFRLSLIGVGTDVTVVEFLTMRGRTYTIQASSDLKQWSTVDFRIVTGGVSGPIQNSYASTSARTLRVEVPSQAGLADNRYFRANVQ